MRKIIAALVATAMMVLVAPASAHADARDYDSLTREQAIEALKVADTNLSVALHGAQSWRESNEQNWRRALALEGELSAARRATLEAENSANVLRVELSDARRFLAAGDETARYWQQRTVDIETQAKRLQRRVDRKDATIRRLRAKLRSR